MPIDRLDRTRGTLPEGYQFGDAERDREVHAPGRFDLTSNSYPCSCGARWLLNGAAEPQHVFSLGTDTCRICGTKGKYDCSNCGIWRRPSDNAAARLTSAAYRITQAQIAADLHAGEQ